MPGTLFVVATPIGNLEDVTLRALRTLREVDLIAAEDTRRTAKLLAHYEIRRPLTSLREHNEMREIPRLLERLGQGKSIALVTDAGTPGIADPGAKLVRAARDHGLPVVPIPGPSALTAALSVCGSSADQFLFLGFPPPSGAERQRWFSDLAAQHRLALFFEAPHRIARTLREARAVCGTRPIVAMRELTKIHEELVEWPINVPDVADIKEVGEFVVAVFPGDEQAKSIDPDSRAEVESRAAELFCDLTKRASLDDQVAYDVVSHLFRVDMAVAKKLVKRGRITQKRALERLP
jgi:16S rRNA (cytidine1402-2'-O)-methyltransferase